jgi:Tfp pilus assembly protein PilV
MSTRPPAITRLRPTRRVFTFKQRGHSRGLCHALALRVGGFTLAELLVSILVLVIIVFLVAQLMNNASAITRTGHKHVSTDTQARTVLDRMALDFAQMPKRTDIDYYVKGPADYTGHGNGHGWGRNRGTNQQANDQMAFFTQLPGYYPSGTQQSPFSLVAYRVNQSSNTNRAWMRLERMAKGLLWNGVDNRANQNANIPMVFLPVTIGSMWPPAVNNNNTYNCNNSNNDSCDLAYEIIGPGVFRFEYYYVLKNGRATDVPWDTDAGHTSMAGIGLGDVEAIGVVIAVIDSTGRAILDSLAASNPSYAGVVSDLAWDLADFQSAHGRGVGNQQKYIGQLEAEWNGTLFGDASLGLPGIINTGNTGAPNYTPVPLEALKAIKIYSRTFDLKTLPTF